MNVASFWSEIGAYNEATWPVQILIVIAAAVLTGLVIAKPGRRTDVLTKVFLSFAFAWNGVVYFLLFARNPIATFVGAPLFVVVAILFALDIFAKRTRFRLPDVAWKRVLMALWVLLVFLYPFIGFALGHVYPQTCTPMMPCPLTVFAIALVVAAIPRADKRTLVFLLPWALLGLPKCLGASGCYEDCVLFAAGVYGLIMLIRHWRNLGALLSWRTAE